MWWENISKVVARPTKNPFICRTLTSNVLFDAKVMICLLVICFFNMVCLGTWVFWLEVTEPEELLDHEDSCAWVWQFVS